MHFKKQNNSHAHKRTGQVSPFRVQGVSIVESLQLQQVCLSHDCRFSNHQVCCRKPHLQRRSRPRAESPSLKGMQTMCHQHRFHSDRVQHCYLPAAWPWASHTTTDKPHFLHPKTESVLRIKLNNTLHFKAQGHLSNRHSINPRRSLTGPHLGFKFPRGRWSLASSYSITRAFPTFQKRLAFSFWPGFGIPCGEGKPAQNSTFSSVGERSSVQLSTSLLGDSSGMQWSQIQLINFILHA